MLGLQARDLWDSAHSGPEGHGYVRVRRHPWDGLVDGISHRYPKGNDCLCFEPWEAAILW